MCFNDYRRTGIVRPTKKPTNFGPIRGVPKYGAWRGNVKKVLQTEGGEGRWGQSVWSTFLRFSCFLWFFVPQYVVHWPTLCIMCILPDSHFFVFFLIIILAGSIMSWSLGLSLPCSCSRRVSCSCAPRVNSPSPVRAPLIHLVSVSFNPQEVHKLTSDGIFNVNASRT